MNYRSSLLQSCTSLSYPVCPAEENLISQRKSDVSGNWGHLNWQECSNCLNPGSVLREMAHVESFSCHQQHFSFAQLSFQAEVLALSSHS